MKILIVFTVIMAQVVLLRALSKEEFLKLPHREMDKYVTVVGISKEYAIANEEFDKLSSELQHVIFLEKGRESLLYAIENVGKKYGEIDLSRLSEMAMRGQMRVDKDQIVNYLEICGIYFSELGDCDNAIPYCRKHYLEWKKFEAGKPALFRYIGGGDYAPDGLNDIANVYEECRRYKELDWFYGDYHKSQWLNLASGSLKERLESLNSREEYREFMVGWEDVRKRAKTATPTQPQPYAQNYKWFYSDKQEEVLKALAYYNDNKVRFMLEKALKNKDAVVAAKAKEYLDKFKE